MSFGSSNPPWQRNTHGNTGQPNPTANLQSQMMNTNFVGFQNLAMPNQASQNNLSLVPQLGANINALNNTNTMFANHQAIQYQNRSGLNPNAFGLVQTAQQMMHHQGQSQSNQSQIQGNQNNATSQICNNPAFKWNTNLVQQVTAPNQGHNMNMRPNPNQSQHSAQSSQSQQQQSTRNFSNYSSSQLQNNNYGNKFDRSSNSVRNSSHSSRQTSPPARRNSTDRSSRRDEEERKRRKERER